MSSQRKTKKKNVKRERVLFCLALMFLYRRKKKSTGCDCGSFATESTGGLSCAHEGAAGGGGGGGWTGRKIEKKKRNDEGGGSFFFFG